MQTATTEAHGDHAQTPDTSISLPMKRVETKLTTITRSLWIRECDLPTVAMLARYGVRNRSDRRALAHVAKRLRIGINPNRQAYVRVLDDEVLSLFGFERPSE